MGDFTEPAISDNLTDYDRAHFKTYLRILDGVADGADPAEIARVVLGADMDRDPEHGYRLFEAHHARAVWMTKHGYRELGAALCHHSGRDPPRMSAPVPAHYGIYRTPCYGTPELAGLDRAT